MKFARRNIAEAVIAGLVMISCNSSLFAEAIYVSPSGNDANSGTAPDKAFKTIEKARDYIRANKLNKNMTKDLFVYLRGGRYEIKKTIQIEAVDSGSNGFSVIYKNYKNEVPTICGGKKVTGWTKVQGQPYYVASVPESDGFADYFRQLYVNGVRAERARSNDVYHSVGGWWMRPDAPEKPGGVVIAADQWKNYTNPKDIRLLFLVQFKIAEIAGEEILDGKDGNKVLRCRADDIEYMTTWGRFRSRPNNFFIVNAFEELDEPGEWYLNRTTDKVYYYPYSREDMAKAEVYAPVVEFLLKIDGTPEQHVRNIQVNGIVFQHGNWFAPRDVMLGRSQAEIMNKYQSEIPGQIILDYADNVAIKNCAVRHMGSCGVQTYEGCNNTLIEGNVFYDLTAAAVSIGRWWLKKMECPPDTVCVDTMIRNNIVRNTGRDYLQGTGINIFAAYKCKVYHNDVSDIAYTALHARIGDDSSIHEKIGKIEYKYNKVSRPFMAHKWGIRDGGALYLHGVYPGSVVAENYALYCNNYINNIYYADNWSHTTLWSKNVSRYSDAHKAYYCWHKGSKEVVFDGNYGDQKNSSVGHATQKNYHHITNDQWPEEAQKIMANAGLQPDYRHLLRNIYGHANLVESKPCSSSSDAGSLMNAEKGSDRNWKTFWESKPGSAGNAWWRVDLGGEYVIQRVTLLPPQDKYRESARKEFEIQASNDADFRTYTVLTEQNSLPFYNKKGSTNMWEKYLNITRGFRYLRVQSKNEALSFAELGAYGYPVGRTLP